MLSRNPRAAGLAESPDVTLPPRLQRLETSAAVGQGPVCVVGAIQRTAPRNPRRKLALHDPHDACPPRPATKDHVTSLEFGTDYTRASVNPRRGVLALRDPSEPSTLQTLMSAVERCLL